MLLIPAGIVREPSARIEDCASPVNLDYGAIARSWAKPVSGTRQIFTMADMV